MRPAKPHSLQSVLKKVVNVSYFQHATISTFPQRIYHAEVEAEDPDHYHNGRFYPVRLGDTFKDDRYRVTHKLGWGGYATVWLARDLQNDSNVALKIINSMESNHEFRIMHHLRNSPTALKHSSHPGRNAVVQLLDDFHLGVSHRAFVLDVMGSDVASRIEARRDGRLPRKTALALCFQIIMGLDYLWKCGVSHGDLWSRNVLFTAPAISSLPEEKINTYLRQPRIGQVKRLDGGPLEAYMPSYLVGSAMFRGSEADIKITDLGNAFFHDESPEKLSTPWHMRAPEAIYGKQLSKSVDMWSVGCLIFEILTGRTFVDSFFPDREVAIRNLNAVLGPPPTDWLKDQDSGIQDMATSSGTKSFSLSRYLQLNYDQDLKALQDEDDDEEDEYCDDEEDYERPHREFTDEELEEMSVVLARPLSYEPAARGTPETLLSSLQKVWV